MAFPEAGAEEVTKVTWAGEGVSETLRRRLNEGVVLEPLQALF